jgi:cell cycle sensor histidine kinase DivJ
VEDEAFVVEACRPSAFFNHEVSVCSSRPASIASPLLRSMIGISAVWVSDRRSFLIAHLLGGLAGLGGALAWAILGHPQGLLAWAALVWLASPLLLAGLAWRGLEQGRLEAASCINSVLVLTALSVLSGGLASIFLVWLILVPAEAAVTRRPYVMGLAIFAGTAGIGLLWFLTRRGLLPAFALTPPWDTGLQAMTLLGALTYAGLIAAEVQRIHQSASDRAAERDASFRFVTENAADPILRLSASGFIAYASPASTDLFGREAQSLEGELAADLVAVSDRVRLQRALVRAAYFGEASSCVCQLTGEDERFVELRCRAVASEAPRKPVRNLMRWREREAPDLPQREIIVVARDISQHHALEARLEHSWRTAEAQNRAKSRFLANMSHELRTPLNSIIGFSEMIGGEIVGPVGHPRYREYAGLIRESGHYLLDLINDILDIAKIEAGKFTLSREEIDIGEALKRALRVMVPQYQEKGVALKVKIAQGLPRIEADARAIRQIVFNLLSNALKFTAPGGRALVSLKTEGKALLLEIQDTGVGIMGEDLKRLARPFEQAGDAYVKAQEGTGLGLSLVRSLTGLHGGTLSIRSKRGAGTSVTVSLPLPGIADGDAAVARAA